MTELLDRPLANVNRRQFLAARLDGPGHFRGFSEGLAFAHSEKQEYAELETTHGRIRGLKTIGLSKFKGIPYGGSVSGANRFKAAPPLQSRPDHICFLSP